MFGRRKKDKRRRPNIVFVTFRLILSLLIFAVLLGGVYSAYKQFSGVDPVKLSPGALISSFASGEKLFNTAAGLLASAPKNVIPGRSEATTPESSNKDSGQARMTENGRPKPKPAVSLKFALMADSHNENNLLAKALSQTKEAKAPFIIGLGDYTEVGTVKELEDVKKEFDLIGIRYFLTAGDHDLWDSRDRGLSAASNFNQVFGPGNQAFIFGNAGIIILDNGDNYTGFGENQINWLNSELEKLKGNPAINAIFVMVHEPLYHPSSTRVMGKVTPGLKEEAGRVIKLLKDAGIKQVFSGDIHYFTEYSEPETGLPMTTIGATASLRNTQNPRFGMVTVYEDGSYKVEDVEIK